MTDRVNRAAVYQKRLERCEKLLKDLGLPHRDPLELKAKF